MRVFTLIGILGLAGLAFGAARPQDDATTRNREIDRLLELMRGALEKSDLPLPPVAEVPAPPAGRHPKLVHVSPETTRTERTDPDGSHVITLRTVLNGHAATAEHDEALKTLGALFHGGGEAGTERTLKLQVEAPTGSELPEDLDAIVLDSLPTGVRALLRRADGDFRVVLSDEDMKVHRLDSGDEDVEIEVREHPLRWVVRGGAAEPHIERLAVVAPPSPAEPPARASAPQPPAPRGVIAGSSESELASALREMREELAAIRSTLSDLRRELSDLRSSSGTR